MGLLIGNIDNSLVPDSVKTALDETVPMYGLYLKKPIHAVLLNHLMINYILVLGM